MLKITPELIGGKVIAEGGQGTPIAGATITPLKADNSMLMDKSKNVPITATSKADGSYMTIGGFFGNLEATSLKAEAPGYAEKIVPISKLARRDKQNITLTPTTKVSNVMVNVSTDSKGKAWLKKNWVWLTIGSVGLVGIVATISLLRSKNK